MKLIRVPINSNVCHRIIIFSINLIFQTKDTQVYLSLKIKSCLSGLCKWDGRGKKAKFDCQLRFSYIDSSHLAHHIVSWLCSRGLQSNLFLNESPIPQLNRCWVITLKQHGHYSQCSARLRWDMIIWLNMNNEVINYRL